MWVKYESRSIPNAAAGYHIRAKQKDLHSSTPAELHSTSEKRSLDLSMIESEMSFSHSLVLLL